MNTTISTLNLDLLDPSPTNPRKKFDTAKLAELMESIKEQGVILPLIVRKTGDRYEIVAGERRWRASKLADMVIAPCIVREMTDGQVLEHQLIENLQRSDLEPLEEARGFRQMMDMKTAEGAAVHTAESVALKIGKSSRYVQLRLKLLNLPDIAIAALENETIAAQTGQMLGRIPDPKMREKAVKEVLRPKNYDRPLTGAETKALIERNYMRTLEGSSFDQEDPTLLPEKIVCSACPNRAGNCPDIEGVRQDMCLNPVCFEKKSRAAFDRWKSTQGDTEGKKFLTPAENKRHVSGDHLVSWSSNLIALDEVPAKHLMNSTAFAGGVPLSWRILIEGRGVEVVVARKADNTPLECADREKAMEAARLNGHNIFKLTNKEERLSYEEQQKREREEKKKRQELFQALLQTLMGKAGTDTEKWLRQMVAICLGDLSDLRVVLTARKLGSGKTLLAQIATAKAADLCDIAAQVAFAHGVEFDYTIQPAGTKVLKAAGIDPKKVEKDREAAAKKKEKPAKKPPSKPTPAKGKLADRILPVLTAAGDEGILVGDIARKLGEKPQNLHVWFATTGKSVKGIQKIGTGKFRIRPGTKA